MALSSESLITSYSTSFHPTKHFSTKIWPTMLAVIPEYDIFFNSLSLYATPPPVPPKVKAGLTITG